ncbi:MAG: hypothetical protein MR894_07065 [Akkermansia muciniphila]|nr:hypothetical protein [Akkermansia muciniphila]
MSIYRTFLKICRHLYFRKRHLGFIPPSPVYWQAGEPAALLNRVVASDRPYMVARFGSVEMYVLSNYFVRVHGFSVLRYIRGEMPFGDWNVDVSDTLCTGPGFFPRGDIELAERFCTLMLESIPELDVLGSWLNYEALFDSMHHAQKVHICNLEPFDDSGNPWSQHLAGRRVLVVHPFARSILSQYRNKRELLFRDKRILPEFDLSVLPAVQSIGGNAPAEFRTWFDAYEYMKKRIDETEFDVCLLGCGAYGFPLAAHIKRTGRQAFHLGGSLQLLFGIKGKRWTEQYGQNNPYLKHFNEHWVFPSDDERPADAQKIENACYW